jgi:hypothetical protein
MAMRALLQGNAGANRIRGALWELGSSTYRAYVHLVPATPRSGQRRSVLSAEGATLEQALGATEAQVESAVGHRVEHLEVIPGTASTPEPDTAPSHGRIAPRRDPPPTD